MKFWWVNHRQTHKHEISKKYLWSPKKNANGNFNQKYENLTKVNLGDIIFSHTKAITHIGFCSKTYTETAIPKEYHSTDNNWNTLGWKVMVDWIPLNNPINYKEHLDLILPLCPKTDSPINKDGNACQGYLSNVPEDLAIFLLKLAQKNINHQEAFQKELIEQNLITDIINNRSTEKEQIILSRRGQGLFKSRVSNIEKSCRLTGITDTNFLIASHIKPWRNSNNEERLDGYNGLLLSPHIDFLFDRGYISFTDKGQILAGPASRNILSLWKINITPESLHPFQPQQQEYLQYHRKEIFRFL